VPNPVSSRLLSIGEFAAATQLSPKALRLYDEQQLLAPARIEPNGYRSYRVEQVPRGRLIRTLREMDLSLADIGSVVALDPVRAQQRLSELAREQDRKHALAKRSYQTALGMVHGHTLAELPVIATRARQYRLTASCEFTSNRHELLERYRMQVLTLETLLSRAGLTTAGNAFCALLDPLSDDDGRFEAHLPIEASTTPPGVSLKDWPQADCATITLGNRSSHASDVLGALDALFDWFDREGCHAVDAPQLAIAERGNGLETEILWAYERSGRQTP
jgi:DNA-binding transcriptional MerR regulator